VSDTVIRIEGLGKRYRLGERTPTPRLRELLHGALHFRRPVAARRDWFWALRNVSLQVRSGEVVGLLGANGAGKTTLLKILSRITLPTEGFAEVYGHIGSLLEVGTGFHHDLTGRENVFLSGAILGMARHEIRRRFDEIVAFAEIEPFIDTPVRHYSAGMQVRLGFAVAAHLQPEILIIDEVLAVGDMAFQEKCLHKVAEVARNGRAVLLVSHNIAAVERLCTTAYLLDHGRLVGGGPVTDVAAAYQRQAVGEDAGDAPAAVRRVV
jgi:lipopolysaccharide transport system ATP-binding protein